MSSRVIVITGASAGIGRATARAFAARGARIGLIARNAEALEVAKKEVESRGGEAVVAIADVADADAVERAAQTIERAFGRIDVWVNNAMTSVLGPIQPQSHAAQSETVRHDLRARGRRARDRLGV